MIGAERAGTPAVRTAVDMESAVFAAVSALRPNSIGKPVLINAFRELQIKMPRIRGSGLDCLHGFCSKRRELSFWIHCVLNSIGKRYPRLVTEQTQLSLLGLAIFEHHRR